MTTEKFEVKCFSPLVFVGANEILPEERENINHYTNDTGINDWVYARSKDKDTPRRNLRTIDDKFIVIYDDGDSEDDPISIHCILCAKFNKEQKVFIVHHLKFFKASKTPSLRKESGYRAFEELEIECVKRQCGILIFSSDTDRFFSKEKETEVFLNALKLLGGDKHKNIKNMYCHTKTFAGNSQATTQLYSGDAFTEKWGKTANKVKSYFILFYTSMDVGFVPDEIKKHLNFGRNQRRLRNEEEETVEEPITRRTTKRKNDDYGFSNRKQKKTKTTNLFQEIQKLKIKKNEVETDLKNLDVVYLESKRAKEEERNELERKICDARGEYEIEKQVEDEEREKRKVSLGGGSVYSTPEAIRHTETPADDASYSGSTMSSTYSNNLSSGLATDPPRTIPNTNSAPLYSEEHLTPPEQSNPSPRSRFGANPESIALKKTQELEGEIQSIKQNQDDMKKSQENITSMLMAIQANICKTTVHTHSSHAQIYSPESRGQLPMTNNPTSEERPRLLNTLAEQRVETQSHQQPTTSAPIPAPAVSEDERRLQRHQQRHSSIEGELGEKMRASMERRSRSASQPNNESTQERKE